MKQLRSTVCMVLLSTLQGNAFLIIKDSKPDAAQSAALSQFSPPISDGAAQTLAHPSATILSPPGSRFAFNTATAHIRLNYQASTDGALLIAPQDANQAANSGVALSVESLTTPNSSATFNPNRIFAAPLRASTPSAALGNEPHTHSVWAVANHAWIRALMPVANPYSLLASITLFGLCIWRRKIQNSKPHSTS